MLRFCHLNGTTPAQCSEYFGLNDPSLVQTGEGMRNIANLLGEDLSVVQTVFAPTINFDRCGRYGLPRSNEHASTIRYCQECASLGYHSYLHELHWLAKCPFHQTALTNCPATSVTGSIAGRRRSALKAVMQRHGPKWLRAGADPFLLQEYEHFLRLREWVSAASLAAERFSEQQIWDSDDDSLGANCSLGEAIGRLRTISPMPRIIEPLFVDIGKESQIAIQRFPCHIRTALETLKPGLSFSTIFDFYKKVGTSSVNPPGFVMLREAVQRAIQDRHGVCHCCWGRTTGHSWSSYWIPVHPDDWPHWACTCPYDVAIAELKRRWGRSDEVFSRRAAEQEYFDFISCSSEMFEAGLIGYSANANLSPEGRLHLFPQSSPCCEWNDNSPLTELLSSAAAFEVMTAASNLNRWLDSIETGAHPGLRRDSTSTVRLCQAEDGLTMIHWSPLASPRASR
jgi:hypothetical protein